MLIFYASCLYNFVWIDLDFSFLEMNPFTLVNGEPYPLDMRGELDDTAAFKNFKKYIITVLRTLVYAWVISELFSSNLALKRLLTYLVTLFPGGET